MTYAAAHARSGANPMASQPIGDMFPERWGQRMWWGRHLDAEQLRQMAVEIEAAKGRISAHERECAQRYSKIEGNLSDLKDAVRFVVRLIATVLITLIGYMAVQLWPPITKAATSSPPAIVAPGASHAGNT